MPGELHEISAAIGELRAEAKSAREARKIVYEKLDALAAVVHEVKALRVDVDAAKPRIANLERLRNRAVGALVGATLLGTGSGVAASPFLSKLAGLFTRGN